MTKSTIRTSLLDKWTRLVKDNREKWMEQYFNHIRAGRYWDVGYDIFAKFKVFCYQFKDDINDALKEAKKTEPKISFEDVAHDCFLEITEDLEKINDEISLDDIEKKIEES